MSTRPRTAHRAFWMRQLHRWHWISAAVSLIGMILFSVTGITLNHAGDIEARPVVTAREAIVPAALMRDVSHARPAAKAPLPAPLAAWAEDRFGISAAGRPAEWSQDEIYLALPRPGGDAWLSIERTSGKALYEGTDRGWISYLNDLHKGRNAGLAWRGFIDVFAVACLVFSATGLLLLHIHAARRPFTWPAVGLGLAIPALLALASIHL